ncbi:thioesterase family protein [Pontibacter sp. SGAir0037]|uniref:acyl-CoA thioesterase n=1 Tax=Pontibacter sp. SGAir0037 TaxID=2571030 RepID=UPI0010CD39A6|nr:acyl-CoA thioesterase [Pontibacter sp. SGAir0037]QCR21325.1 acyl-CoA thioesterase [Pontibacter sp. SGAir0037]
MTEKALPKILESQVLIRFEDCDPFGHLNNGRFIDYFVNAREDQVREHYNFNVYKHMRENGKGWVVTSNQVQYIREVKFMETMTVRTCLRWFTSSDLMVEGQMVDPKTQTIMSVIWTRLTYIDLKKGGRTEHSEDLQQLYRSVAILGEGKQNTYFEERVKEIRAEQAAKASQ